jgi:WD40 repeat protein
MSHIEELTAWSPRLWLRSRNTAISHEPLPSSISVIHLMSDDALLSASIEYGIVARSLPFGNRVLKGYLNATGVPPALRNGNPNADFTPNISACALASDGYTANVLWGKRDGSVSIVSHPDTMNKTKSHGPANINTSEVRQEHEDAVLDGTWAADGDAFVTAGSDGRVKVWTVEPFRCAWTSERHLLGLETDAILRVVEDLANGLVVAASRSGDIIIFSGLAPSLDVPLQDIQKLCVSTRISDAESTLIPQPMKISALYFQASSPTLLSILVCYQDKSYFYRYSVDLLSKQVDVRTFGDPAFGIIQCIQPAFSQNPAESSFIIAGTQPGFVSIYDWDSTSASGDPLPASRHVDLFSDAHVASLAMNSFVIVAGSSRCAIRVLDLLTFETLASFTAPMNNDDCDVRQIVLTGDALIASVGSKVLAWRAGHFGSGGKGTVRIKGKGRRESQGKWFSKYLSDSST